MNSKRNNRRRRPPKITLIPSLLKKGTLWLVNNPLIILASLIASFIGLTDIRISAEWLENARDWVSDNALLTIFAILVIIIVFRWASSPINDESSDENDITSLNKKILHTIPEKPSLIIFVNNSEEALQIIAKASATNNLLNNLPKSEIPKPRVDTEADVKVWKTPHSTRPVNSSKKFSRK
jgi:hypothetical protein